MSNDADRVTEALKGRYRIEREIGEGGMAVVYLARDLKHKRDVALKVLKPETAGAFGEARFQREIEIAARLTHPHIVPLHDSGEADGIHYFVMPVISGGSLAEHLEAPLASGLVSDYVGVIAAGLDYAHAQGIVHRDLKPENILLHEGVVMISDLGIALVRGRATDERFTRTGSSIGTTAYMSPEQLENIGEVDHRSDIYSLGCIAFEMLTGERPYQAETAAALAARVLTEPPPKASAINPSVSSRVDAVLIQALAKSPDARFETAAAFAEALIASLEKPLPTPHRRGLSAAAIVVITAIAAAFLWQMSKVKERDEALASLQRVDSLVEAGAWAEAFFQSRTLTHPAAAEGLEKLLARIADSLPIISDPPGAAVSIRRYASPNDPWIPIGVTPLDAVLPREVFAVRFEREGYETSRFNRDSFSTWGGGDGDPIALVPRGSVPQGMVSIPAGVVDLGEYAAGLWGIEPLELGAFLIDRLEVTNTQYAAFVEASGYQDPQYWPAPVVEVGGRTLSPSEVAAVFVDRTGRPGPSTWELGVPPEGREDHPVTGVSWYEAQAYARFVGKRLPTIYHWHRAATAWMSGQIIPRSNLEGTGTVPAGSTEAESEFGLRDMGGNAREWVSNTNGEQLFMLGGGWPDDVERFFDVTPQAAWDRSESNGIRLMSEPADTMGMSVANGVMSVPKRDFTAESPASDAEYAFYRELFRYDADPLEERIEETDTTDSWIRQEITFEAPFTPERMKIHLFLPLNATPETQVVVHFPGSGGLRTTEPLEEVTWTGEEFNFIVKTGRAVVFPIFLGSMDRSDGFRYRLQDDTRAYRDHVIAWGKELGRTLDYLETRDDLDTESIGFYGFSWGARMGGIMLAIHDRFTAAVLHAGGLSPLPVLPEADPFNYLPRVTQPVLMLNSQFDNVYPIETSVIPFFTNLGTRDGQKDQIITEGGHFIPRNTLVRETLRWFDMYLSAGR